MACAADACYALFKQASSTVRLLAPEALLTCGSTGDRRISRAASAGWQ
jgi:hypothetical protein